MTDKFDTLTIFLSGREAFPEGFELTSAHRTRPDIFLKLKPIKSGNTVLQAALHVTQVR